MVVLGNANEVRLAQLVGVPAPAALQAMQTSTTADATVGECSRSELCVLREMREHMVVLHGRARTHTGNDARPLSWRGLLANYTNARGELRAERVPGFF